MKKWEAKFHLSENVWTLEFCVWGIYQSTLSSSGAPAVSIASSGLPESHTFVEFYQLAAMIDEEAATLKKAAEPAQLGLVTPDGPVLTVKVLKNRKFEGKVNKVYLKSGGSGLGLAQLVMEQHLMQQPSQYSLSVSIS